MSADQTVTVEEVSSEDEFYLTLSDESIKQSVPRLNDALNRLVTLATALTGGALVLLKEDICYGWWRVAAAGLLFLALAAAIVGSAPTRLPGPHEPEAIMRGLEHVLRTKKRWVWVTSGLLLGGLLAALAGVIHKTALAVG